MTVTKFRMTALAPTTKRGFVVGILASLKECRTNIIAAISLGRNQFPEAAKTRFIAPRTGSSNPFPSSGESVANSVIAKAGPRLLSSTHLTGRHSEATVSITAGVLARSRLTISRASSSRPKCA